jgi:hypothetical protein
LARIEQLLPAVGGRGGRWREHRQEPDIELTHSRAS